MATISVVMSAAHMEFGVLTLMGQLVLAQHGSRTTAKHVGVAID